MKKLNKVLGVVCNCWRNIRVSINSLFQKMRGVEMVAFSEFVQALHSVSKTEPIFMITITYSLGRSLPWGRYAFYVTVFEATIQGRQKSYVCRVDDKIIESVHTEDSIDLNQSRKKAASYMFELRTIFPSTTIRFGAKTKQLKVLHKHSQQLAMN